ncbi:hypothetical protein BDV97DRAFT_78494 [Delphinella strobiligena]|nr:hypothetical protein BDV97DRAFT_78494 [Delphinella strobiligena]
MASTVSEEPSKTAEPVIVHTYHCICTQLILATTTTLDEVSIRSSDKSHICALPETVSKAHYASLSNTSLDDKPTVIRLEDGFEKRFFEKCARCDVIVGYHLDKSQYEDTKSHTGCREDVVYLLPGGLLSTVDMQSGKNMEQDIGKIAIKA